MATGYDDPAVQIRRLGGELRKTRLDVGKTQRDVAEAMEWSISKLIRIENGEVRISKNDLRALLQHYGMTDKRRVDPLLEAARAARERPWSDFRKVHSSAFLSYLGFESSAWIIREYEPYLLPGLLQTAEYALAVQTEFLGEPSQRAERRWEARQQRQKLHERDTPPKMFFILDEAAIRRPVGGLRVMRRQLERLKDWSAEPHISLQVLPFEVGAYHGMGVPFVLLEFQSADDEDVLYLEHATERTIRDDPEEIRPYLSRFFELEKIAMSLDDSDALFDLLIHEIDAGLVTNTDTKAVQKKGRKAK